MNVQYVPMMTTSAVTTVELAHTVNALALESRFHKETATLTTGTH
jgi:hypothetical protein